jgi:hypothetical protein
VRVALGHLERVEHPVLLELADPVRTGQPDRAVGSGLLLDVVDAEVAQRHHLRGGVAVVDAAGHPDLADFDG